MNAGHQKKHRSHFPKGRKPAIKLAYNLENEYVHFIVRLLQYNFLVFSFCHAKLVVSRTDHTQIFYRNVELQEVSC